LKDIAAEQVNSRKLETCFGICSKKKSEGDTRIVIYRHCCACMVSYAGIISSVHIRRDPLTDLSRGWSYGCIVEGSCGQSRHSACSSLLPVWPNANHGCLATELLISI
jgi:hypothetical protein